jgi:signal transduction histidine kinase
MGEWQVQRKDGSTFPVEASTRVLLDGRIEAFIRDITERKRTEQQLQDATRRLMTVVEQCPVGIVVVLRSPTENRVLSNLHARRLFGCSIDPARGVEQFLGRVLAPDGRPMALAELPSQRAMRGELVPPVELLIVNVEGRHTPIVSNAAALVDGDGTVHGAVVVFEDISAQKERERLRAEWSSLVAHDLRQPLNAIAIRTGLLARTTPGLEEPLEQISTAVVRLNRMVQDLLDLSRLEVRRMDFDRRPVDIAKLVRDTAVQLVPESSGRPLRVRTPEGGAKAEADPDRVAQVVENLVTNALKYGAPGTPIGIEVAVKGSDAVVSVTNEGEGISPEALPRVFDRFYRVQQGGAAVKGVGLGLYIAREIVEAHGGSIGAESQPGGTTTFHFTLPRLP